MSWSKTIRNLSVTNKALLLMTSLMIFAIIVFVLLFAKFPPPSDDELKITGAELKVKYLEQYIDLLKAVMIGIAVTLISVIIPNMLTEVKDKFEQYKESRLAYSRAKTSVLYLADRVANVDQKKAFILVEEAHRELHFAETFEDIIIDKGYLNWFGNPILWIAYNYWQINAIAEVLRKHDWDKTGNKDDLRNKLLNTVKKVRSHFKPNEGNWLDIKTKEAKKSFEDEIEDELKKMN